MKELLARAAEYLARTQHMDGSWSDGDPFVCARATNALDAAGGPELAKGIGVGHLERLQAEDGRFPGRSGMYTDAACTAYALIVLNRFDYSRASLPASRGLLWLLEHQSPDGSWSGRNRQKNAYTTSLCLRALHAYSLSGLEKYRKGVEQVVNKLAEPGFFNEPVAHVYAPILNLSRIGQLPPEARVAFARYADDRISNALDGGQIADIACIAGTLAATGELETYEICADFLPAAQNGDGGFGKGLGGASEPNWTALTVLALSNRL